MKFLYILLIILLIITLLWTALCQALSAAALIEVDDATNYAAALLIGAILLIAGTPFCFTRLKWIGLVLTLAGALTIFITGSLIKGDPVIGTRNVTFLRNQISLIIPLIAAAAVYTGKHLD